jgi:zinc D-Ala-D-Ala dipeptidase
MRLKIARYKDLKEIPDIGCNKEKLVPVESFDQSVRSAYLTLDDMKESLGGRILVREEVAKRIARANRQLKEIKPNFVLHVCYGYRSLEIQKAYYNKMYKFLKEKHPTFTKADLIEAVHKLIAVPGVAGHPTGGAVDVTLYDVGRECLVDMGGEIADFSDPRIITFAEGLTDEQRKNREVLRNVLMSENFAPFLGEWWHFSYGDKEWAFFYGKKYALYRQSKRRKV